MLAQFDSECALCPTLIERGSIISAHKGEWAHARCTAQQARREANETVCGKCFIVKPCECDS